jgi:hypothetical protein
MLKRLRGRITYANVMSTVAVFMAMGGVAWAAALPKNSVGTAQLKKNAVTSSKIKNGQVASGDLKDNGIQGVDVKDAALNGADVADGGLTAADLAAGTIPPAMSVVVREQTVANVAVNQFGDKTVLCNQGEKVVGGGGGFSVAGSRNYGNLHIETETRITSPVDSGGNAPADGAAPAGWRYSAKNNSGTRDFHAYVLCATP